MSQISQQISSFIAIDVKWRNRQPTYHEWQQRYE